MYLGFGHVEGSNKWKTVCFGNLGYVNCNVHHVTNLDKSLGKGFPFIGEFSWLKLPQSNEAENLCHK